MGAGRKIRILLAKPGLDGHDRGIKLLALAFRDAGMEVIYLGRHRSPQEIVRAAIQEDVDVIGLSNLSGSYKELFPKVIKILNKSKMNSIKVIGGGIILDDDIKDMEKLGIKMFPINSRTGEIIDYIKGCVNWN
ncbi:MAG: cobalamin B12-binding domain-containing protein [Desulfobacteria bacterium]